jgi:hypothetical protein
MVDSSVSIRLNRSAKTVSIRLKWQTSSFSDHLSGNRPLGQRRFVEPRRQPPDLGGLSPKTLYKREMYGVFCLRGDGARPWPAL